MSLSASVKNAAAAADKRRGRNHTKPPKKSKVRFTQETKEHDGLLPVNHLFDQLTWVYFQDNANVSDFVNSFTNDKKTLFRYVELILLRLIIRSKKTPNKCVPILPKGGGRCTKIKWNIHGKVLENLYSDLVFALDSSI